MGQVGEGLGLEFSIKQKLWQRKTHRDLFLSFNEIFFVSFSHHIAGERTLLFVHQRMGEFSIINLTLKHVIDLWFRIKPGSRIQFRSPSRIFMQSCDLKKIIQQFGNRSNLFHSSFVSFLKIDLDEKSRLSNLDILMYNNS